MEYRTVFGNLFDFMKPGDAMMHGCNNLGVMGSGIALEVKTRYPGAYTVYRNKYDLHGGLVLGEIIPYFDKTGVIIINAITQNFYGKDGKRYVKYDAVAECCRQIREGFKVMLEPPKRLYFPLIGAGLGGGSWNVISEIIKDEFDGMEGTELILVEYR